MVFGVESLTRRSPSPESRFHEPSPWTAAAWTLRAPLVDARPHQELRRSLRRVRRPLHREQPRLRQGGDPRSPPADQGGHERAGPGAPPRRSPLAAPAYRRRPLGLAAPRQSARPPAGAPAASLPRRPPAAPPDRGP